MFSVCIHKLGAFFRESSSEFSRTRRFGSSSSLCESRFALLKRLVRCGIGCRWCMVTILVGTAYCGRSVGCGWWVFETRARYQASGIETLECLLNFSIFSIFRVFREILFLRWKGCICCASSLQKNLEIPQNLWRRCLRYELCFLIEFGFMVCSWRRIH